jgi:hypothetical protein
VRTRRAEWYRNGVIVVYRRPSYPVLFSFDASKVNTCV